MRSCARIYWETLEFLNRRRPDRRRHDRRLPPCDSIACLVVIASVKSHHDWLDAYCEEFIVHKISFSSPEPILEPLAAPRKSLVTGVRDKLDLYVGTPLIDHPPPMDHLRQPHPTTKTFSEPLWHNCK